MSPHNAAPDLTAEPSAACPLPQEHANANGQTKPNGCAVIEPNLAIHASTEEDALLPTAPQFQIQWLPPHSIVANPQQPRNRFDRAELKSLTASVREHGVLQPVTVRRLPVTTNGHEDHSAVNGNGVADGNGAASDDAAPLFQLIAGERRWRAAQAAGLSTIPAIVRDDLDDEAAGMEVSLVENLQRTDLNPIEEAKGYLRLMRQFSLSEERIAQRIGRSRQSIRNGLKLLQLPLLVQERLAKGELSLAHGLALGRYARFPQLCVEVARHCVEEEITAAELSQGLPNLGELRDQGLLVYMIAYDTRFDFRSVCPKCPHKAFLQDGHGRAFCLKPEEWDRKQQQALQEIERQEQDEAAQVMAQAKAQAAAQGGEEESPLVDARQLRPGSYRDLSASYSAPPEGCSENCPCRSRAVLNGQATPICLDPARYTQLFTRQAERQKELRRREVTVLAERARAVVIEEWRDGKWHKVVPLLTYSLLLAPRAVVDAAARQLNFVVPLERLFGRKTSEIDKWKLLAELDADRLLALASLVLVMREAKAATEWSGHDCFGIKSVLGQLDGPQPAMEALAEENSQDEEPEEPEEYHDENDDYDPDEENTAEDKNHEE